MGINDLSDIIQFKIMPLFSPPSRVDMVTIYDYVGVVSLARDDDLTESICFNHISIIRNIGAVSRHSCPEKGSEALEKARRGSQTRLIGKMLGISLLSQKFCLADPFY